MKIKEQTEDFQVEELTNLRPEAAGPFSLYRLKKRNLNTLDALQFVRQRWKIERQRISFGGLKDRHAETVQYFTILHGPERQLNQTGLHVEYLGRTAEPFTSKDIRANQFRITVRDMAQQEIQNAQVALEEIGLDGVPNYFDEQRFGSAGSGEFVARHLVQGEFEAGLRLALTGPYEFDNHERKQVKAFLLSHWGDWKKCINASPKRKRGETHKIFETLIHNPTDFHGALRFIDSEQRQLYLNAFQSYLWNRMLARWLERHLHADQLFTPGSRTGARLLNSKRNDQLLFYRDLSESQRADLLNLRIPLPTARAKIDPSDPGLTVIEEVLKEEGLQLRNLKVKGLREWFFSKGERPAICLPDGLKWETAGDERHTGKQKMILTFDLQRGSYATLVMRRITTPTRFAFTPNKELPVESPERLSEQ